MPYPSILDCQIHTQGCFLHGCLGPLGRGLGRHHRLSSIRRIVLHVNPGCRSRRAHKDAVAGLSTAQAEKVQAPADALAELASALPIGEVLPALIDSLEQTPNLVLRAPPGAGKTTVVPLAPLLHGSPWLAPDQRILVLEPRRLAARAAAVRMAANMGERVGDSIGYRTRVERRVGRNARIEVVTTGVLLRRLQRDPALKGVAAVILDEFHERSVEADLALALCLDCQKRLRPELRLVVMSATLSDDLAQRLTRLMSSSAPITAPHGASTNGGTSSALTASQPDDSGGSCVGEVSGSSENAVEGLHDKGCTSTGSCRVLSCEGKMFPVATKYMGWQGRDSLPGAATAAVLTALQESPKGDVLVFLPGAAEIRRTQQVLMERVPKTVKVLPLYGALPLAQQDAAVRLDPTGARRVVLATSIAESSLTIEGVRAVIDSGHARVPVQDDDSGLTRLATVPASLASVDQRRGRAGRIGPGICYRMWSEAMHAKLPEAAPPEILSADLAPLALQLASWREDQPDEAMPELEWLDAPPEDRLQTATKLLQSLGALDSAGQITSEGRSMAALGEHPRLARLVLTSAALGCELLGCLLAALISEGDFLRGSSAGTADVRARLRILVDPTGNPEHQAAMFPILKAAERLLQSARSIERDGFTWPGQPAEAASMPHATEQYQGTSKADGVTVDMPAVPSPGSQQQPDQDADMNQISDQALRGEQPVGMTDVAGPSATAPADVALSKEEMSGTPIEARQGLGEAPGSSSLGGAEMPGSDLQPSETGQEPAAAVGVNQGSGKVQKTGEKGTPSEEEMAAYTRLIEGHALGPLPGVLIAVAYPERIAQRQSRGNRDRPGYTMASGTSVRLPSPGDPLGREDLLAVASAGGLQEGARNNSISLAAPLDAAALEEAAPQLLQQHANVFWAPGAKAVVGRLQRCIGAIVLEEEPTEVTDEQALTVLLEALCNSVGSLLSTLKVPDHAVAFRQRVIWLRTFCREALKQGTPDQAASQTPSSKVEEENRANSDSAALGVTGEQGREAELQRKLQAAAALPDFSDAALAADVKSWLAPHLRGLRNLAQVQSLDWHAMFRSMLDESQLSLVEELAPEAVQLSDDCSVITDYSCDPPCLAEVQSAGGGTMEGTDGLSICLGMVKVHKKQESIKSPAQTGNRKPLKTSKGGKKRSRK
ncbi:probable pre-mRNA-splicing factor ATP-dependent RNA helica at N-terminal half [Coccomyxa sp. Obi]|nr:probable pre-mRNA-splicing factor ATP-dependent RNA helica at N-terminal half [Coccomyxa sp. Obi]